MEKDKRRWEIGITVEVCRFLLTLSSYQQGDILYYLARDYRICLQDKTDKEQYKIFLLLTARIAVDKFLLISRKIVTLFYTRPRYPI